MWALEPKVGSMLLYLLLCLVGPHPPFFFFPETGPLNGQELAKYYRLATKLQSPTRVCHLSTGVAPPTVSVSVATGDQI